MLEEHLPYCKKFEFLNQHLHSFQQIRWAIIEDDIHRRSNRGGSTVLCPNLCPGIIIDYRTHLHVIQSNVSISQTSSAIVRVFISFCREFCVSGHFFRKFVLKASTLSIKILNMHNVDLNRIFQILISTINDLEKPLHKFFHGIYFTNLKCISPSKRSEISCKSYKSSV